MRYFGRATEGAAVSWACRFGERREYEAKSSPRYFSGAIGAIIFIDVVAVLFASLLTLQRMLGTISYAP